MINKKKEDRKSYAVDLKTRYEVTFKKELGEFKKGDTTSVTLPIALKWIKAGYVDSTGEISRASKESGTDELLKQSKEPVKETL